MEIPREVKSSKQVQSQLKWKTLVTDRRKVSGEVQPSQRFHFIFYKRPTIYKYLTQHKLLWSIFLIIWNIWSRVHKTATQYSEWWSLWTHDVRLCSINHINLSNLNWINVSWWDPPTTRIILTLTHVLESVCGQFGVDDWLRRVGHTIVLARVRRDARVPCSIIAAVINLYSGRSASRVVALRRIWPTRDRVSIEPSDTDGNMNLCPMYTKTRTATTILHLRRSVHNPLLTRRWSVRRALRKDRSIGPRVGFQFAQWNQWECERHQLELRSRGGASWRQRPSRPSA